MGGGSGGGRTNEGLRICKKIEEWIDREYLTGMFSVVLQTIFVEARDAIARQREEGRALVV